MLTCSVDLSEFRACVAKTLTAVESRLEQSVERTAGATVAFAKRIGPFKDRTTNLRTRIVARFVSSGGGSVTWEVLSPMYYSKFVDRGTSRSRPYPFMTPAEAEAERVLRFELARLNPTLNRIWS
jgi:hypothetical protein